MAKVKVDTNTVSKKESAKSIAGNKPVESKGTEVGIKPNTSKKDVVVVKRPQKNKPKNNSGNRSNKPKGNQSA